MRKMNSNRARHTPAPWIKNGNVVSKLRKKGWPIGNEICSSWVTDAKGNKMYQVKNWDRNAPLIAAAPRMFDWMQRMAPSWDEEAKEIMREIDSF